MTDSPPEHHRAGSLLSKVPMRARITLWVVLIAGLLELSLALVVLLYMRQGVSLELRERMETTTDAVAAMQTAGTLDPSVLRSIASDENGAATILLQRVPSGKVIASAGSGAEAFAMQDLAALPQVEDEVRDLGIPDRGEWFVYTRSFDTPGVDEFLVTVAVTKNQTNRALSLIAGAFLLGFPITLVSMAVATWIVSGIAVRPLHQLEDFAANLNPSTIGRPLEISDISSEMFSLKKKLNSALSRIERAYGQQGRFLANVSHELKTPISVIQAEAQVLMMRGGTPKEHERFVRSTADEMKRLGSMVESFLLLTRVDLGESRIRQTPISAHELIMDVIQQCQAMASNQGVQLRPVLCEDEEPPIVRGTIDLLETALGNLVRNAISYSTEEQVVEIACEVETDQICIHVRDQGPGVPDELIPNLFQPYSQASRDEHLGKRVTGLGLQIAMGIMELHNGTIKVRNLDAGCEFTVCFRRSEVLSSTG